jgi:hypothetical protein
VNVDADKELVTSTTTRYLCSLNTSQAMRHSLVNFWVYIRHVILKPFFVGLAIGFGVSAGRALFLRTVKALEKVEH